MEAQEVVPIQDQAADRSIEVEATMRTMEFVVMQPKIELVIAPILKSSGRSGCKPIAGGLFG